MNRFRPRAGTPAPYTRHLNYIADSAEQAIRDVLADYIAISEDFIIEGGVVEATPSGSSIDYTVTEGSACVKGEVMPVVASSVSKSSTQVAFFEIVDEGVDDFPVLNIDGETDYVLRSRYVRLAVASAYPETYMPVTAPRKEALELVRFKGKLVPAGAIMPYHGELEGLFSASGLGVEGTRMEGWAICNGLNGTVDLRGLVPFGATDVPSSGAAAVYEGVGGNTEPGDLVGADLKQIAADQLPAHTHSLDFDGSSSFWGASGGAYGTSGGTGNGTHNLPAATEAQATEHDALDVRQASRALVFIQSIGT